MVPLILDIREVRTQALRGQLSVEQLLHIIEEQQRTIDRLKREARRWLERLAHYEPDVRRERNQVSDTAAAPSASSASSASYSVDAEEQRRRPRRRRKKSPGRRPTVEKFADAQRIEDVYPPGVRHSACQLVRERAVWRLENGRAVRVGYRIFAAPGGQEGRIPGVTPRCEYGIETLVVLAFLVYVIGMSLDKACAVLAFFCQLPLPKSQADALLRQLAQHWDQDFDALCELLARAAVVYMDETGWKVGNQGCSLWAFAAEGLRVFLFGCRKDDATLDGLLPPDLFDGVGVSDDAAVYCNRFQQAQKCWAHLLRKMIKLALLYPRRKTYQRFLDQLLELYYDAKRAAADGRLGEAGRQQRVADLEGRLCDLCLPYWRRSWRDTTADLTGPEHEFTKLVNELLRLMEAEELFTFSCSRRLLKDVLYPREHSDGAGKPDSSGRKGDYLLDLLGGNSHGEGLSHVRTNGAFSLGADGDGEFEESTSLGIRRTFSARQGKHLPGLRDLWVSLNEILICVGWPWFHESLVPWKCFKERLTCSYEFYLSPKLVEVGKWKSEHRPERSVPNSSKRSSERFAHYDCRIRTPSHSCDSPARP